MERESGTEQEGAGPSLEVNAALHLLSDQFEYVFLIGLRRPGLLFSLLSLKSVTWRTRCDCAEMRRQYLFEAWQRTRSLSATKGGIDLAESSRGNL